MESLIVALFVCVVLAIITKYLSIPAIPFYILAGVLLGKAGGGLLTNNEVSQFFSEMGLIFLLFFMGLGLKPERIASNRAAVLTSGIIDLNINMIIGFAAAYMLGFSFTESLIIAAAFYISSTAMALTSLIENRKLMLRESDTVIWLMVFEDLQIRAKTGATVIAVCRHDRNIINPPPTFTFEEGDAALVIGESDQIKTFEREIMVN